MLVQGQIQTRLYLILFYFIFFFNCLAYLFKSFKWYKYKKKKNFIYKSPES